MADWKKISLDKFIEAYNSYPPNRWTRFAFKYFSKSTEVEDMKLSNWVIVVLSTLFGVGFIGTVLNWSKALLGTIIISYSALLAILVIFLLIAIWMNNVRIKKISKSLGVNVQEYNWLVNKYF